MKKSTFTFSFFIALFCFSQQAFAQCPDAVDACLESNLAPVTSSAPTSGGLGAYCDPAGATVCEYLLIDPNTIVGDPLAVPPTDGPLILGASQTPIIVPADYGLAVGDCYQAVPICYDLAATQALVTRMNESGSCCGTINSQTPVGVTPEICDAITAIYSSGDEVTMLSDILVIFGSFGTGDISIAGFSSAAATVNDNVGLLSLAFICGSTVNTIEYCVDPASTAETFLVVADLGNCIFPIELISFTGKNTRVGNELTWEAELTNVSHFEVEASTNGYDFKTIDHVMAGSAQLATFSYTDKTVSEALTYYRLKVIDFDGSTEYTKTITVSAKVRNDNPITVYPNPVSQDLFVDLDVDNDAEVTFSIVNAMGQVVETKTMNVFEGNNSFSSDMSNFTNGVYFLVVQNNDERTVTKFVKK